MLLFSQNQIYKGLPTSKIPYEPYSFRKHLLKLLKTRLLTLERKDLLIVLSSVFLIVCMSLYFYIPSSLYIYVVLVCYTSPALLAANIWNFRRRPKKVRLMTRRNLLTGAVTIFMLLCLINDVFYTAPVPSHWHKPSTNHKYYIASLLHNSKSILPRYKRSLVQLVKELGPENVFVSIYENDSTDGTPVMLRELNQRLRQMGAQTHIVTTKQPGEILRKERIERLSLYRNLAMEPLNSVAHGGIRGQPFNKVIWINDVLFEPSTVHALLDTEGGEFDQACAMDFCWLGFYDTWVMRDADGHTTRPFWPYFREENDQNAVRAGLPVPVNACWNGITAFDARWFSNSTKPRDPSYAPSLNAALTLPLPPYVVNDGTDQAATLPLTFRPSSQCFSSESLMSSLDMHRIAAPHRPRIYVNPNLVVTYDKPNYFLYGRMMKWSVVGPWRYIWQYWVEHRIFGFALHILGRVDPCTDKFMPKWVPRISAMRRQPSLQ